MFYKCKQTRLKQLDYSPEVSFQFNRRIEFRLVPKIIEGFSWFMLPNHFVAKREQGSEPPLPCALLKVAQVLANWRSTPPLCYAGHPARRIEFSDSGIADYMAWLKYVNASGIPKSLSLSSHDWKPELTFYIFYNKFLPTEELSFALPSKQKETLLKLDRFMEVVAQVCPRFGAYYGYTDNQLLRRHWLAKTGVEDNQMTSSTLLNESIIEPLPELLHFSKFDSRRVPDGIWWVNFWDSILVETVGLERIQNAPWAGKIKLPEGGVVVATTEEPTDAKNPIHLAKLAQIAEHLGLRELQERYRVPEPADK